MAREYSRIEDILNNTANRTKMKNFIDEAVRCKQAISDKNEDIKAIAHEAAEQINIDPKLFKQLVGITFKNNFTEKQAEISALDSAIELLFATQSDQD